MGESARIVLKLNCGDRGDIGELCSPRNTQSVETIDFQMDRSGRNYIDLNKWTLVVPVNQTTETGGGMSARVKGMSITLPLPNQFQSETPKISDKVATESTKL